MKAKSEIAAEKNLAALTATRWVRSGMRLGLGSGSTAEAFLVHLAEAVRRGALRDIVAVPTSEKVAALARAAGIALATLEDSLPLDLTVDGADEVGPGLQLIKGGGGALLREKVVASASRRNLIIADSSKLVARLGTFPLPLEVAPFAVALVKVRVARIGGRSQLRFDSTSGQPAITDQGWQLLDCHFGPEQEPGIDDPRRLQTEIEAIPGVGAHGLFLETTSAVVVADGPQVQIHTRDGVREPAAVALESLPGPLD